MRNFGRIFMAVVLVGWITVALMGCGQANKGMGESTPPKNAIILFDGKDFSHWTVPEDTEKPAANTIGWKIVGDAMEIVPGSGSIMTKQSFQDIKLHIEFRIPERPAELADKRFFGNSGVYIQRRYEVQILDSYGIEPGWQDCGAIYKTKIPDKDVCKKPGEWQTYDIVFHTPRFEGKGDNLKKVKNARITVVQNGVLIHDNVEIPNKTGAGHPEGPEPGPILLQDHGSEIRFRNIWVVPLD